MSIAVPASAWLHDWHFDALGVAAVLLAAAYLWAARGGPVPFVRRVAFTVVGCAAAVAIACGPITEYAPHLFWVRALQITLLLYVVPLGLASGMPVTVFGGLLSPARRSAALRALRSPLARVLGHPAVGSGLLLVTPWVLLFSGWNLAAMRNPALDLLTRCLLVGAGFVYFYTRVQADPVPRRYPQGLSLLITLVESLADGVLGIVVWLGPLLYTAHYAALGFSEDSMRLSQTVGAGMLWLLADLFGLPFLVILMFALRREDAARQVRVDAAEDARDAARADDEQAGGGAPSNGLWWESDPELASRYHR
ncbi:cytochrome c oxidase assembly protein [Tsukamurella pseudospumae]|uniref:cytochrome c oxidase assembly protein n=1 Tax=Tsukamurella pseudospumae TaxID=239498 RepID=UPI000837FCC6|nr:cytochrome c oxidase assembly protein [Tsukamurella pseudospumae]